MDAGIDASSIHVASMRLAQLLLCQENRFHFLSEVEHCQPLMLCEGHTCMTAVMCRYPLLICMQSRKSLLAALTLYVD